MSCFSAFAAPPWTGKGRGRVHANVSEAVGNTPCVEISDAICPNGRTIYAKLEYFSPLSSVKDRTACAIIEDAEKRGLLKHGSAVVEATSGNTGIAIAMLCAQRGYRCIIVLAESFSIERRKLMRFLGAKVITTLKSAGGTGMVAKAKELSKKHGWFLCRQFENEANVKFHYETTGQEILRDFYGERLDFFVRRDLCWCRPGHQRGEAGGETVPGRADGVPNGALRHGDGTPL